MSLKSLITKLGSRYKIKLTTFTDSKGEVTVYSVDGSYIRSNMDVDFVLGGHGYIYSYIPKDEIWVEKRSKEGIDCAMILVHEIVERQAMMLGKEEYEKAHEVANSVEAAIRFIV